MSRWKQLWRIVPLLAMLSLLLSGCGQENLSALQPKGPVAEKQLTLITISISVMIFVLIVVFVLYAYVLVKYRRKKGQTEYPKQVEGNHKLEIIWTVIPFFLLLIIAVPTVKYTFELDKDYSKDPNALQVRVSAHQFWWEFEYLDQKVKTAQDLVIPTGRVVSFHLETADVIHSFWVPALGGKKDTNPGMTNYLFLKANEPGVYLGKCAELCGQSHALMDFKVRAVPQEEFDRWITAMQTPTKEPATELAKQGETIFKQSCISCHAIYATDDKGERRVLGGGAGPNLVNFGNRETVAGILYNSDEIGGPIDPEKQKKNVRDWLKDPQKIKPGNMMPNLQKVEGSQMEYVVEGGPLSDQQIDALVEFLVGQKQ
ncbi:cytochrome c oxidase subunit II [Paenibacillus thermoaerophilus]|uniref:Cytochrome c oxidase subunit 2 n=1 Tax=Paenibacillus thermoaerophilus TaxID=1215385 RepID=A0ABW2V050_9BACL|nr:cytochrome c oxidase subunit II [Paenibacillus thermoaerophilus]